MPATMRIPIRKSKRTGTQPIGVPMMRVPESVTAVGDETGKPYFRFGDSSMGPETVTVTPPQMNNDDDEIEKWAQRGFPGTEPLASDEFAAFKAKYGDGGVQRFLQRWREIRGLVENADGSWSRPDRRPVSMATGGYAVIGRGGGSGYDPTASAIARNRRRRDQLSQVYAARRNVADLQNTGMQQTLQDSQDYKYSMAGVARPQSINVPYGTQGLSPLVRPAIRTLESKLSEQFSEENALADLDDDYRRLTSSNASNGGGYRAVYNQPSGGGRGVDPGGAPFVGVPFGTPDSSGGPAGHVRYTDPNGYSRWLRPGDAAIQKARDNMALEERAQKELAKAPSPEEQQAAQEKQHEARMKREGYVLYRDPVTRQSQWLSPFDAALRKSADEDKLEAAVKAGKPPESRAAYSKVSPQALVQAMVDGDLSFDEGYAALLAREFSREEIDFLVRTTKKSKAEGSDTAE